MTDRNFTWPHLRVGTSFRTPDMEPALLHAAALVVVLLALIVSNNGNPPFSF